MEGSEIRRWAWQSWKENAGFVLLGAVLSGIPDILVELQTRFGFLEVPALLWVEKYIGTVLSLGFILAVLTLIRERTKDLSLIFAPLGNKKALLLALILTVYNVVKDGLDAYTEDMKLINLAVSIITFVISVLFFTLEYDLFLFPDRSLRELFQDSAAVGERNFGDIFTFQVVLTVIMLVPTILFAVVGVFFSLGSILAVVFVVLYMSYMVLAIAGMAMEVSGVGNQIQ